MKFAIQHAIGDPAWHVDLLAPDALTAWSQAAERSGWDAIAFTDHPAPTVPWIDHGGEGVADLFTALAFCAAVTSKVRLLTYVLVPAYRNPLVAAHQLATLDRLSGGRLTVGLGTGYLFGEFRAVGAEPSERLETFDGHVDLMRKAWSGDEIKGDSFGSFSRPVKSLPPVMQLPHPPLWIHGNSRFGTDRAAAYGDGWLAMMTGGSDVIARTTRTRPLPDIPSLTARIGEVRAAAERAGRDPAAIEIAVAGSWPMLDIRSGRSPAVFIDEVGTLAELGVDWTVSLCSGDDVSAAQETVEWFGETVIGLSQIDQDPAELDEYVK